MSSDIFLLCAASFLVGMSPVLYRKLAGRLPFLGTTHWELKCIELEARNDIQHREIVKMCRDHERQRKKYQDEIRRLHDRQSRSQKETTNE